MASYTLVKNTDLFIDLPSDIVNEGWEISGNIAYHSGCNSGYIDRYFDLSSASQWTFKHKIESRTSGAINIVVNGVSGPARTTLGEHEDTFNVTGSNVLVRFFSTGTNSLSFVQIYPQSADSNSKMLAFNEKANRFITYFSMEPDCMLKFGDRFFMFKSGGLWEQNVNPIRNNFFGVQYPSIIKFFVNGDDAEMVKNFFSLQINSNEVWSAPAIQIFPHKRKPNGMKSRLKRGNFVNIQGQWFADFLKNMTDPRFDNELTALMKGGDLQGAIMEITIQNNSNTEVRLMSVKVKYSKQNYTT